MLEIIALGLIATTAANWAYSAVDLSRKSSVKIRTEKGDFEPIIKTPRKKHGLIILGNDKKKTLKEIKENTSNFVYETLKEKRYNSDNLYVLGGQWENRFDCHDLPFDKKHLREIFGHLSKEVKKDDVFFMYVLCHGWKGLLPLGRSSLIMDDGKTIKTGELEELLSDVHPDHSITFFNNCYSGGFAKRLGKGRNIAISTSRPTKFSWAPVGQTLESKYGEFASVFTLFFYSALRNQMPNGEPPQLENISIGDAFDYASQIQHNTPESRLLLFGKNTPYIVYGKINPKEVRL